ncbi:DUF296 domain-containing protein [bacterium]|nr:DUF296 domain-containing protein [bacterium]
MIWTEVDPRTRLIAFAPGESFLDGLLKLAAEKQIQAARFTAIGAFSSVTLGYFDRARKDYQPNTWNEQVEACSLIGNISLFEGQLKVHCHAVIGTSNGSAHGGHLLQAIVWPTLEVFLDVLSVPLARTRDPQTGLALFPSAE